MKNNRIHTGIILLLLSSLFAHIETRYFWFPGHGYYAESIPENICDKICLLMIATGVFLIIKELIKIF
jgi:hypothetical protein